MRIGIYPGSFNPWHEGHDDILEKALDIFDIVIIAIGRNSGKDRPKYHIKNTTEKLNERYDNYVSSGRVMVKSFDGLLVDFVKEMKADGVIRGLRNGHDLQYEMNQQYWNEDLGISCRTVYFITDRKLSHISSSAIRAVGRMKHET